MSDFKGTPGPWSYQKTGEHWNNPSLINIEINFGNDGECIADTVYQEHDAMLISAAPELLELVLHVRNCVKADGIYEPANLDYFDKVIAKALGK